MSKNSEQPRILLFSTAYLPLIGGSELAIKNITDRLPDVSFDLVTGRYDENTPSVERIGNVRVFRVGGWWSRWNIFLPKLFLPLAILFTAISLVRNHQYTLMHVFQASQAGGGAWLVKKFYPHLPLITTLQEGKDLYRESFLMRFFRTRILAASDAVSVISTYLKKYVASVCPRTPVYLIPNGVAVDRFLSLASERGPSIRAIVLQNPGEKIILSASRLVPKNGLRNLILALPAVRAQVPARLVLLGDGPLHSELESLARDIGMSPHIVFRGGISHDDVAAYLGAADVFARPSLSEGLGSAFLEAMACRVPVVASAVGGIPDFLIDGKTGLVCDPHNPAHIAATITRLLSDAPLAESIRQNAFATVKKKYDWEMIAEQTRELYNSFS